MPSIEKLLKRKQEAEDAAMLFAALKRINEQLLQESLKKGGKQRKSRRRKFRT
jgi:hypothetical protein